MPRRICIFAGSSPGARPTYLDAARAAGAELARRGIEMVYGGAAVGLMGAAADAAVDAGGRVIGVIPKALFRREVAHQGVSELRVVDTMHERKTLMAELSDGFVALPGGLGTFDELFEVLTWAQLGAHEKPVGVLDVDGYFGPLQRLLEHGVTERFVRERHRSILRFAVSMGGLLDQFAEYEPPRVAKWIDAEAT